MSFVVLVPARLASSRLPRKPLADIHGAPMVVRVVERARLSQASRVVVATDSDEVMCACRAAAVERARLSQASRVVVATDSDEVMSACRAAAVECLMTRADHASGSDRLAEACAALGLSDDEVVVNVQGDEPLIEPALVDDCAALLRARGDCVMSTVAHAIHDAAEFVNPNVVKVVLDRAQRALYFSRAPIPWWRDGSRAGDATLHPDERALRHVGLYAYRAGFLRRFPTLEPAPAESIEALEQLRVLWHGERIAVHVSATVPPAGVDTPEDLERVRREFALRT